MSETDPERVRLVNRLERERSARRQAEQIAEEGMRALWLANRELEERVAERTIELQRMLRAREQADHARQELVRNASHELATPLHAVRGNLELIEIGRLDAVDGERILQARASADELNDLVPRLIQLLRVDLGDEVAVIEEREPVAVADDIIERWQRPAAQRGQLVSVGVEGIDELLAFDWQRLLTIVDVLVGNAVENADPGALDVIIATGTDAVTVTVEDAGPVHDSLRDVDPRMAPTRWIELGDIGAGLAIANQLCTDADGTMLVEPSSRDGLRVAVTLPRS